MKVITRSRTVDSSIFAVKIDEIKFGAPLISIKRR